MTPITHTIIRHPTRNGWTYRIHKWWEYPVIIARRKAHPTAIAAMLYLRSVGMPPDRVLWPMGPSARKD